MGVTKIADSAFNGCYNLTSVTIPESVTEIGAGAFAWCPLTEVTIPNASAIVDKTAFDNGVTVNQ